MKSHYEKVITGCCFMFIFANVGLASTAFAVHQPYLVAMPGIGDTGGSLILSVRTLLSLLAMLVVDRYYRMLDVRVGVTAACFMTCAGFMVYSVAASLPVFFAGAVLLGLGYGLGGNVAMTYLANRWYKTGIGGVIGFATMGSGLASFVVPLIVVRIIEAASLSVAFTCEGALAAVVGVLSFALLRNRPSDLGMEPHEGKPGKRARRKHEMMPAPAGERHLLMVAMVSVGIFCCGAITYLSVLATSSGFDPVFAALLVSISGFALTASKFATGVLFDRVGTPRGTAIMFALGLVGFAGSCCAGVGSAPLMVVSAVLMGAGMALGSVGISVWSIDLSEPADRARQIKNFQVAYAFGAFIANTLPGIVKDLFGSYIVSYVGMFAFTALAAFIILRFYRKYEKRV